MRYPTLMRLLSIVLVLACLLTLMSGAIVWFRADREREETLTEAGQLRSRFGETLKLSAQLDIRQGAYDAASAVYPGREEAHRSDSNAYRMKLATFTATRAGLVLGRAQLDEAGASLDESMELFKTGLFMFLRVEEAFQSIYDVYELLRGTLDTGSALYEGASEMLADQIKADREYEEAVAAAEAEAAESGEEPVLPEPRIVLDPEQVLALSGYGHTGYAQMTEMLTGLRDGIPDDQHQAGDFVRQAMEEYGAYGPGMADFSVEALAYGVSQQLYDEAAAAMQARIDEGMSEEEAYAAADQLCQEAFGLSFEEVGQWLDENEPESGGGEGGGIPPEMMSMVLDEMPSDKDLLAVAIALVAEGDKDLSDKEAAYLADPHDVGAAELLLTTAKDGLDASERILGLVEPTILQTKEEMTRTHEQLDAAWFAIYSAQLAVQEGYVKLEESARDLIDQRIELRHSLADLEKDADELEALRADIDDYEGYSTRFRSARAGLLSDSRIEKRVRGGGELFAVSLEEIGERAAEADRALEIRRLNCVLMLDAAVFGLLAALCACGVLSDRRLWFWLLITGLFALAGEWLSLREGRALWTSAAAIYGLVIVMLPFSFLRKKGEKS